MNGTNGAGEQQPTARRRMSPATTGSIVFALLVGLTILEYLAFLWIDRNLPIMVAMNVADAVLIMVYFMHLPRLWRREAEE